MNTEVIPTFVRVLIAAALALPISAQEPEVPEEVPQEVPQEVPGEVPQELPEEVPSEFPEDFPGELPEPDRDADGTLFWANPPRGPVRDEYFSFPEDEREELNLQADDSLNQREPVEIEHLHDFYVVLGFGMSDLGYSENDLQNGLAGASGITPDVNSVDDTDVGGKAYLGYRLHDRIALEVGVVDLGSVRSEFEFTGPPGSEAAIEQAIRDEHGVLGNGITAGLRGFVLDGTDFDISAKVGAFFWDSELEVSADFNGAPLDFVDRRSGTDLFYGLGVHYDLSDEWALQLEYELYNIDDETAGQLAVSARYGFDL